MVKGHVGIFYTTNSCLSLGMWSLSWSLFKSDYFFFLFTWVVRLERIICSAVYKIRILVQTTSLISRWLIMNKKQYWCFSFHNKKNKKLSVPFSISLFVINVIHSLVCASRTRCAHVDFTKLKAVNFNRIWYTLVPDCTVVSDVPLFFIFVEPFTQRVKTKGTYVNEFLLVLDSLSVFICLKWQLLTSMHWCHVYTEFLGFWAVSIVYRCKRLLLSLLPPTCGCRKIVFSLMDCTFLSLLLLES